MNTHEINTTRAETYIAPAAELLEMTPEGMLCESNEYLYEDNGEW